jgi:hypothetical protein
MHLHRRRFSYPYNTVTWTYICCLCVPFFGSSQLSSPPRSFSPYNAFITLARLPSPLALRWLASRGFHS